MTTETTQEAGTLERRLMEAVDGFREDMLYTAPEHHGERIEEFRVRLRDIVVAATGVPESTESTLERVLDIIHVVDLWLDSEVAPGYQAQPLAQDWARVTKAGEEVGEAIDALIGFTGQNPRKGTYGSREDLLKELGDIAVTGMFAIQHFTKSADETASVLMNALEKAAARAAEAGYE